MVVNRSAPRGAVVPALVYEHVGDAIDWLCETFGFTEVFRYGPPDRPQGAQLAVGDGAVFLTIARGGQSPDWDDSVEFRPPRANEVTHAVTVDCADADAQYERVTQRGARTFGPPESHPFGERQFTVEDLAGHRWTFSQSVADVAPADWGGITP